MDDVVLIGGENEPIVLNYKKIRKSSLILRAINHPLRKEIIVLLDENEPMNVTDIYVQLRIEQSVASQHLAILRKSDIVDTHRDGKYILYTLNRKRLEEISNFVDELSQI